MRTAVQMEGRSFGLWTVLERAGTRKCGTALWRCRCACGTEKILIGTSLRIGDSKSCGCARFVVPRAVKSTHGLSSTKTYKVWQAMKTRCRSPACKSYKNYGARGIDYAPSWETFEGFLADMGLCPEGLTLERKDNNLGYSKDNCIWDTHTAQARNKRSVPKIRVLDKELLTEEFAQLAGRSYKTVQKYRRQGLTGDAMLKLFKDQDANL